MLHRARTERAATNYASTDDAATGDAAKIHAATDHSPAYHEATDHAATYHAEEDHAATDSGTLFFSLSGWRGRRTHNRHPCKEQVSAAMDRAAATRVAPRRSDP